MESKGITVTRFAHSMTYPFLNEEYCILNTLLDSIYFISLSCVKRMEHVTISLEYPEACTLTMTSLVSLQATHHSRCIMPVNDDFGRFSKYITLTSLLQGSLFFEFPHKLSLSTDRGKGISGDGATGSNPR